MKTQLILVIGCALTIAIAPQALNADEVKTLPAVAATAPAPTNSAVPTVAEATPAVEKTTTTDPAAKPETNPAEPASDQIVIDYHEADIQNVVRTLATRAGINLIMGEEIAGKVTVHFEGVGYEEAVRFIVESKGYAYVKDKSVVRIKTKESLDAEPVEARFVNLNYAKAEDVKKTLESLLTRQGKVQVDTRGNSLVFSDTPSNLSKIIPLIEKMDTQTPQVMIEAKFVETTKNPKKDLGINWGGTLVNHEISVRRPDPGTAVNSIANPSPLEFHNNLANGQWTYPTAILDVGSFSVLLSYLNSDSDTELLANPRVVTTDNGKAKIAIATQYPIPQFTYSESKGAFSISGFEYKDIGIVLNVTPRINKGQFVTLDVAPEAGSQAGVANFQGVNIPIIDNRAASTTVLIKSGNTLAIGGLMRQDSSDQYTKVPLMGDIPGIGRLFRSKSLSKTKRDLLIFVTPTIVNPEAQTDLEKNYAGMPKSELYTNDKWMPTDGGKPNPRNLVPWSKDRSQNFGGK